MVDKEDQKLPKNSGSFEHERSTSVLPGALFITGVTFASIVGGFGYAIGQARRRSSEAFDARSRTQEGVKLALRALGWGTVLAVSGAGLLVLSVKTALGVKDAKEFGLKMKSILPAKGGEFVAKFESWRIPRNKGDEHDKQRSSLGSDSKT